MFNLVSLNPKTDAPKPETSGTIAKAPSTVFVPSTANTSTSSGSSFSAMA